MRQKSTMQNSRRYHTTAAEKERLPEPETVRELWSLWNGDGRLRGERTQFFHAVMTAICPVESPGCADGDLTAGHQFSGAAGELDAGQRKAVAYLPIEQPEDQDDQPKERADRKESDEKQQKQNGTHGRPPSLAYYSTSDGSVKHKKS